MRALLGCLVMVLVCPATAAAADVRILSAGPDGPVLEGRPVAVVIETDRPVDSVRLTFPDLQGGFGGTVCALGSRAGAKRFVLPYRPGWPGVHVLQLTVTEGACGLRPRSVWRLVRLEAQPAGSSEPQAPPRAPAPARASGAPADCPAADVPPIPRQMRAAREAVVCLLNAERAARGLAPLRTSERLRRIASRVSHRPAGARRRGRRGEQRTVTAGSPPAAVMRAWLANPVHRRDLLRRDVRRVGVSVVARFPEPLRRPETTYVVELS